MDATNVFAFVY